MTPIIAAIIIAQTTTTPAHFDGYFPHTPVESVSVPILTDYPTDYPPPTFKTLSPSDLPMPTFTEQKYIDLTVKKPFSERHPKIYKGYRLGRKCVVVLDPFVRLAANIAQIREGF